MRIKNILLKTVAHSGKGTATVMLIVLSFFLLSVSQAYADVIYYNDFEGDVVDLTNWTSSGDNINIDTAPNTDLSSWGSFLGQFVNDEVTLELTGLSEGWITVSFDTYFIRSWDGNDYDYGADWFSVSVYDGMEVTSLLYDTFSNGNPDGQTYIGNGEEAPAYAGTDNTSMTGSSQQYSLGYSFYDGINEVFYEGMDSIYNFTFSFYNTSDYLELIFAGIGLQEDTVTYNGETYFDESWGLDKVSVELSPVPEPATLLLLVSGAFGLIPLSRRRKRS